MSTSASPLQMMHIYYRGKNLELLDSDGQTPLYHVNIGRETPQFKLVSILPEEGIEKATIAKDKSACTATFSVFSFKVRLNLHGNPIIMARHSSFTRTYVFYSPSLQTQLFWEADGMLTGDYRLVDSSGPTKRIMARFHNKFLSNSEVGAFEIVVPVSKETKDEIVITGLADLVMLQSLNLAGIILFG